MAGLSLGVKVGEFFQINENIRVELSSVKGGKATIRVIAPSDVRVFRQAIIEKEAARVAGSGPVSVSDSTAG
jgi:carbon storage regulator CsrA